MPSSSSCISHSLSQHLQPRVPATVVVWKIRATTLVGLETKSLELFSNIFSLGPFFGTLVKFENIGGTFNWSLGFFF